MISEHTLSEKWWWRTLKVIYIFFWIIAISVIGVIAYSNRPQSIIDESKININCVNKNNSFWDYSNNIDPLGPNKDQDQHYRKECQYGLSISDYSIYPDVSQKNYSISSYYDVYGSSQTVTEVILWGFILSFIVIETVKTVLLYIVGIKIWKGLLSSWLIYWYVGAIVGFVLSAFLGEKTFWTIWVIYMIALFIFPFLRKKFKR